MKKGFGAINILLIVGIIALIYLGYDKYAENSKDILEQSNTQDNVLQNNTNNQSDKNVKAKNNLQVAQEKQEERIRNPKNPIIPLRENPDIINQLENEIIEENLNGSKSEGFYENSTYNYSILYPTDWLIKVRSDNNISFGIVPPKNGQGAITIEVGEGGKDEIEEIKKEVDKYAGMINLKEETINLAGIAGTRFTITSSMAGIKNTIIILEKYGFDYAIKYSEESSEFAIQAEEAIKTFKFTK